MKVFFSNLGCKLNQAEVESLARDFHRAGFSVVSGLESAELHVVNTCTVTHLAARDSRKLARRGARLSGDVRTVLTGCYATEAEVEAASLEGVDLVVPNDRKHDLLGLVKERFPDRFPGARSKDEIGVSYVPIVFGNTRAALKVEDGCNMRCAFCIIPYTRGRQRSRSVAEVVSEMRSLVATGVREVVVTGVQISAYRSGEDRLSDLVEALLAQTAVERLRLTSIAPWQFDERLFTLLCEPRVCRHVHLSLQSGCDETLQRMRRPYSAAHFASLVERLRREVPGLAITTDVIVGFPGETQEEFERSLSFVTEIAFARTHVFTYSLRPGTLAAELPGHVAHDVKKERTRRLLEVARAGELAFNASQLGEQVDVLWEDERGGDLRGTSDNYLRVRLPLSGKSAAPRAGDVSAVRVAGTLGMGSTGVLGELVHVRERPAPEPGLLVRLG